MKRRPDARRGELHRTRGRRNGRSRPVRVVELDRALASGLLAIASSEAHAGDDAALRMKRALRRLIGKRSDQPVMITVSLALGLLPVTLRAHARGRGDAHEIGEALARIVQAEATHGN